MSKDLVATKDMDPGPNKGVDLGFFNGDYPPWDLEKEYEDFELQSRHFPSKIGGKPAWLDLANLPKPQTLQCKKCGDPTRFLLQIYSPDNKVPSAFHRTIFVFLCVNNQCWDEKSVADSPVLVLRCQLGRENRFYPADPPVEDATWRTDIVPETYGLLCPVCGCRGDKACGRCRQVSYCSPVHQRMDWRKGHKQECKEECVYSGPHAVDVLKEGLMEIEEEPDKEVEQDTKQYQDLVDPALVVEDTRGVSAEEWEEVESGQQTDKASEKFNSRVRRAPQQIIRYDRRGSPLLCTYTTKPVTPPNCTSCGSARSFEFQIMPQLLSVLGLGTELEGGVDWGSVYVFTCDRSCDIEGYSEETASVLYFDQTNLSV